MFCVQQAAPSDLIQDLASFLLTRSPYSWLGWGWGQSPEARVTQPNVHGGCSRDYYFPPEFNEDYGEPHAGAEGLCKETTPEVFERVYSKATVQMDCALPSTRLLSAFLRAVSSF